VPALVFLGVLFISLWVRRALYNVLERWTNEKKIELGKRVISFIREPLLHWLLILGAYIALQVSVVAEGWKSLGGKILASILIAYVGWVLIQLSKELISFYLDRAKAPKRAVSAAITAIQVAIVIIGITMLLQLWGAPMAPVLIGIVAALVVAILVLREVSSNLISGFLLTQGNQIRIGDLIKLGSGEEGYVKEITWRNTQLATPNGSIIIIPNAKLMQTTIIKYEKPLKMAKEPFHFSTRLHLKELTGLEARNLSQLAKGLEKVPDSVVYFHTHSFLEEHHFLVPEPANDFALWVEDALGYEVLAERLASIDIFEFPTLGALRARIIGIIQDFLSQTPDGREAPAGEEFHFIKSIGVVLPTPYVARDLREFVDMLRRVSIGSLYFHIFESRLRLQRGANDFSVWLEDSLGEKELAEEIARLDPYNYTLENLRGTIIQLCQQKL